MSTIKSSDEHLTLNADGTSKDIKFQANGVEKASISSAGAFTSTTIDATKLTGTIPNFTSTGIDDNADATAITINSSENVGIGTTSPDSSLEIYKASTAELMIGSDNGGTAQISLYENNSTTKEATIKYDGFANNLVIGTSGQANAIVIPRDSGIVTMPSQPAFQVDKNADQTLTVNSEDTVTWEDEVFDVGSNFASNTFTAPVTGKYFLQAQARIDSFDTAATYYRWSIETSNQIRHQIIEPEFAVDLSYYTMSVSGVFQLDAGDIANVKARQVAGTASHIDDTISYTNFCGYLLG